MLYLLCLFLSTSSTLAATWSSAGCYKLSDLESYLTSQGEYTYQTNSYCENLCSDYSVAATLDGSTCYCGNSLPSSVSSVSSSNCDSICQGYGTQNCGGDGYLSVFTTGSEDTGSDTTSDSGTSSTSEDETTVSSTTSTTSTSSTTTSSTSTTSSTTSTSSEVTTTSSSTTSTTSSTTSSSSPITTSSTFFSSSITTTSSSTSTSTTSSTFASTTPDITSTTIDSSADIVTDSLVTSVLVVTSVAEGGTKVSTITSVLAAATDDTVEATSSAAATSNQSSSSTVGSSLSRGAVAGIAVGSVVGSLMIVSVIAFGLMYAYRRKHEDDDQEYDNDKPLPSAPPIHNEDYRGYYGFQQPLSFYGDEEDKRLSNGSLMPEGMRTGKDCLRVTNPDDSNTNGDMDNMDLPESTLHDTTEEGEYSSGDESWKK